MILYIIIVLLMGLVTPIQTAANARLRVCVGYAYVSTLVSFAVSALALVAISRVTCITAWINRKS